MIYPVWECETHFSLSELVKFPTEVPGQDACAYFCLLSYPIHQAMDLCLPGLVIRRWNMRILSHSHLVEIEMENAAGTVGKLKDLLSRKIGKVIVQKQAMHLQTCWEGLLL